MQGKVEIAGVNTAKLKVLKSSETMELRRLQKMQVSRNSVPMPLEMA